MTPREAAFLILAAVNVGFMVWNYRRGVHGNAALNGAAAVFLVAAVVTH